MTTEKLKELISANNTKNEIWEVLQDCEKDCWIKIKTPHNEVLARSNDFRKSLIKLLRNTYEDCCKKIENA